MKKGGSFLIEETASGDVFTPEDFSEEQKMIRDMTEQFVEDEVLPQVDKIEGKDWSVTVSLLRRCGELGLLGVPAFMFQECFDPITEQAFREIARLTRGAYCRFDPGAVHQLGELLRAAAAYAAGGLKALSDLSRRQNAGAVRLLAQMR